MAFTRCQLGVISGVPEAGWNLVPRSAEITSPLQLVDENAANSATIQCIANSTFSDSQGNSLASRVFGDNEPTDDNWPEVTSARNWFNLPSNGPRTFELAGFVNGETIRFSFASSTDQGGPRQTLLTLNGTQHMLTDSASNNTVTDHYDVIADGAGKVVMIFDTNAGSSVSVLNTMTFNPLGVAAGISGPSTATDNADTSVTGSSLSLTEPVFVRASNGTTTINAPQTVNGVRTSDTIPINVQSGAAAVLAGAITEGGFPLSVGGWSLEWVVGIDGGGEYTLPVTISAQALHSELSAVEAFKAIDNALMGQIPLGDDDVFVGPDVIISTNVSYTDNGGGATGYFNGDTEGGAAIDSTSVNAIYHESTQKWKRLDASITTLDGGAFGDEFGDEFA